MSLEEVESEVMEIVDLITPESIVAKLPATSKKQALQELAKRAAGVSELVSALFSRP